MGFFDAIGNIVGAGIGAASARKGREWEEGMSNTAVQRRVADLEAAGLNRTLAAGSAASTPPPIDVMGQVQKGSQVGEAAAQMMLSMLKMRKDISKTEAETDVQRAQAEQIKTVTRQIGEKHPVELRIKAAEADFLEATQNRREEIVQYQASSGYERYRQEIVQTDIAEQYGVKGAELEVAQEIVKRSIAEKYGLDEAGQRYAALVIANELAAHNRDWFQKFRVPSSGVSGLNQIGAFGLGAAERMQQDLNGFINTVVDRVREALGF